MAPPPVIFLAGLSGTGKSTLAEWVAAELRFWHLDLDRWDAEAGGAPDLGAEWAAFWLRLEPAALAAMIRDRARAAGRAGAILSFPSHAIFTRARIDAAASAGIDVVILYGPASRCLEAFLAREAATGRGLGRDHWWRYNAEALARYGQTDYADVRLDAFRPDGSRPESHQLFTTIRTRARV